MLKKISDVKGVEYIIRLFVIAIAALTPIILILTEGVLPSLSTYWNTPMQFLFVIANATTSYYFYKLESWKYPSVFLLLLTAFSVEHHIMLHNILAVSFFVLSLYSLFRSRHFKYCFWIYLSSLFIMPYSLLAGEVTAILALSLYHALLLNKAHKLNKRSKNDKNKPINQRAPGV